MEILWGRLRDKEQRDGDFVDGFSRHMIREHIII